MKCAPGFAAHRENRQLWQQRHDYELWAVALDDSSSGLGAEHVCQVAANLQGPGPLSGEGLQGTGTGRAAGVMPQHGEVADAQLDGTKTGWLTMVHSAAAAFNCTCVAHLRG